MHSSVIEFINFVARNTGQSILNAQIEILYTCRDWIREGCDRDPEEILSDWGLEADWTLVFLGICSQIEVED